MLATVLAASFLSSLAFCQTWIETSGGYAKANYAPKNFDPIPVVIGVHTWHEEVYDHFWGSSSPLDDPEWPLLLASIANNWWPVDADFSYNATQKFVITNERYYYAETGWDTFYCWELDISAKFPDVRPVPRP